MGLRERVVEDFKWENNVIHLENCETLTIQFIDNMRMIILVYQDALCLEGHVDAPVSYFFLEPSSPDHIIDCGTNGLSETRGNKEPSTLL